MYVYISEVEYLNAAEIRGGALLGLACLALPCRSSPPQLLLRLSGGSEFRVQGSGLRVQGSGLGIPGSGFRISGSRIQVSGFGFGFRRFGFWRRA